jgi:uncharacterized protein (TIGR00369 family)
VTLKDPAASHTWHDELQRLRGRTAQHGLADLSKLGSLSGLEFLRGIIAGTIPDPPIGRTLDFYLCEAEPARAVFLGQPGFAHYNPIATVHGGWHATLLDSAMACAIHTLVPAGQAYTTLEFKIHCVRPLTERTGAVRAEGKVVSSGRRTATSEARLVDAAGKLYSHGTTTCMIFEGS